MAKYVMREMNDVRGDGETVMYPKIERFRQVAWDDFVEDISRGGSNINRGTVENVMMRVVDKLAEYIGRGCTVKIDGLGTFSASLGIKDEKERETTDEGEPKRNAQSVEVKNIKFKVDKKLVENTKLLCRLERNGVRRMRKMETTKEERLELAKDFLRKNTFMRVDDYVSLTGLSRTRAICELQELRRDENSGIGFVGRGSHKLYVLSF